MIFSQIFVSMFNCLCIKIKAPRKISGDVCCNFLSFDSKSKKSIPLYEIFLWETVHMKSNEGQTKIHPNL